MSDHPDDNLIAAFVAGRASPWAEAGVVEHLIDCGDCRERFAVTLKAIAEESHEPE